MLELAHTVDTTMLTLRVNKREQAPLGQRIRPVGMCFYKKWDLEKGNIYQLSSNINTNISSHNDGTMYDFCTLVKICITNYVYYQITFADYDC